MHIITIYQYMAEVKVDILKDFVSLLEGEFDNSTQISELTAQGTTGFPFAEHVNTVCNEKITGIPADFHGIFLVEESYYTTNGRTHASPHLFCFTESDGVVTLTSYDIPEGCDKKTFSWKTMPPVSFSSLKVSGKFTPAEYRLKDGVWEGGSVSMFSPVLKFSLYERFSTDCLEISESMDMNGKRTFGFDEPILYRRKKS